MKIDDLPTISKPLLAKGADVSISKINCVLGQLEKGGVISRTKSPTGREVLTPRQGQLVLDAICSA